MTDEKRTQAGAPRATVLFLAYEQAPLVEAAARSILAQECEPLEIILSDDHSTDGTFDVLDQLARQYQGPHRVRARRNSINQGIGGHYNTLIAEAQGQLLITAAGDDLSVPSRCAQLLAAWDLHDQEPDLVASYLIDMAHDGTLHGVIAVDDLSAWRSVDDWARKRPHVVGAAHAFTKRLWERFGSMSPDVIYEDQIITLRAILAGGGITLTAPLVHYRRGGASASPSFDDTAVFLTKMARANRRSQAEHAQQIKDARLMGVEDAVQTGLSKYLQRSALISTLLEDHTLLSSIRALWIAPDVSWSWRLRKWFYLRYPKIGTAIRQLQYTNKQRRQKR